VDCRNELAAADGFSKREHTPARTRLVPKYKILKS
jgi:hypothetical protein